jgi:hypothetical protein
MRETFAAYFLNPLSARTISCTVQSDVPLEVFRECISALKDRAGEIGITSIADLSLLCEEFGFLALGARLSAFCASCDTMDRDF